MVPITKKLRDRKSSASHSEEKTYVFVPPFFMAKKMAAGIFNATRHSERLFELKNSEFCCEIKF